MSRSLLWIARCLAVVCALVSTAHAREFDAIKKQGKIIVGTEGDFPPFNFREGNKLTGFEVELMELMAKKMGVTVEWKSMTFDALLPGLGKDSFDLVIASHGITEERAKTVTFANPHYCSGGVIVAKDPKLRTGRDLEGKMVAVQTGSSYLEAVKKLSGLKGMKEFVKDADGSAALFSDQVDAWVTDRFVAASALRATPNSGARSQGFLFIEKIASAAAKGNTSVLSAYNKALADVMADGSYTALAKRYFKELDIRCE
jgi:polar amino acid transport system substrate-binding protein